MRGAVRFTAVTGVTALVTGVGLLLRLGAAAGWTGQAEPPEGLALQRFIEPVLAPTVPLTTLAGQSLALDQFRGRVVFLNFWATWCVPCRQEMPALERLHQAYRDRGLVILTVNFKESESQVRAFVQELGLDMAVALDRDGAASRRFRVHGLPVSLLIDPEGYILWKAIGAREWDTPEMRTYLDRVVWRPNQTIRRP
jgi:thiol-disulfide isomerase/thioredoxin